MLAASTAEKPDTMLALLNAGANPEVRNQHGETALMFAACTGHLEGVTALTTARPPHPPADVNARNINNKTALDVLQQYWVY